VGVRRFSLLAGCWLLAACGNDPTSVLLRIGAAPSAVNTLQALIHVDGTTDYTSQPVAGGAPVTLPGTAIVKLADVSELLDVQLTAVLADETQATAFGQVQTHANQQVTLDLTFGDAIQTDGGMMDSGASDGGEPDLSSTDLGIHVIAQDTFFRPNQPLWGTASDSQVWGDDANTAAPPFAIASHTGFLTMGAAGMTYSATLGPSSDDEDVLVLGNMDTTDESCNWGPVARFADANNYYKAYLDGVYFVLQKQLAGTKTVLAQVGHPILPSTYYNIRLQALGSTIRARVWANGLGEPATWDVMATDTDLSSGRTGIRALIPSSSQIHFKSFLALGN
jgi:hypothetical protein